MHNHYFKGRKKKGVMNSLETKYAERLSEMQLRGEILWWAYEPIKLQLAPRSSFTPDFVVQLANGEMEIHETKGFWLDNAKTKIKIAADKFPFRFLGVQHKHGLWQYQEF
ncbi:MAG: hypothetical protein A4S09_02200 [Proteobacteria bacterium SG_bin7]|nr:MAG: hypothetical protein A4S09_02200 [Proteobacteria bacterium SG_bin7]